MLIIAVCDDNPTDRTTIGAAIKTYLKDQHIKGTLFTYDSADKLNSVIESKQLRFDIIFLDIIMDGMDGMTYARLIRQKDSVAKIAFLTSSTEYVYEGYEVDASSYLIKPTTTTKIIASLQKMIGQIKDITKESISITNGSGTQRIFVNDIFYIESQKNQVKLILTDLDKRFTIYTKLDEFEQVHPSKMWIRTHKSYIVNFLYIEQYASDKFVLRDGTVIPISRTYRDTVRECFYTLLHNQ